MFKATRFKVLRQGLARLGAIVCAVSLLLSPTLGVAQNSEGAVQSATTLIDVYKTPSCGCCQKWIDYLSTEGFSSRVVDMNSLNTLKSEVGVQGRHRSCHTGIVSTVYGDYVFEGHVPAEYIKQFLANPPSNAIGLTAPGMPIGSPGMEVGDRRDYYQVILMNKDGSDSIYAHVNAPE